MHVTTARGENLGVADEDYDSDSRRPQHSRRRQSKLAFSRLLSQLPADDADALWDSLVDLVVKTVLVAQPHLHQSYQLCRVGKTATATTSGRKGGKEHSSVCFEILGFDVVIDRTLRPFLLEVYLLLR